jgi:hypothetical protein
LDSKLLEALGLLHNNKIEREMLMQRFIDPAFAYQVPKERAKLISGGKNAGKLVHRYPYWYSSSFWGKEMRREPKTFGSAGFHGNFISQIPIMAIKRFTHVGDLVIDLTAGSCTTLDTAEFLHRRCLGFDLYPFRKDVLPADAEIAEQASLIIMHPPYADLAVVYGEKRGGYLRSEDKAMSFPKGKGLSIPPADFLVEFKNLIQTRVVPNVLPNGHVVLVIGDGWRDNSVWPLTARTVELFLDWFRIVHYITKYVGDWTQRQRGIWEYRALARGFGVLEHEYVIVFKKLPVST